jgi:hypothetical protein
MSWFCIPTGLSGEKIASLQVSLERDLDQSELIVLASCDDLYSGDTVPSMRYIRNSYERHALMGDVARDLIAALLGELGIPTSTSVPQVMMRTFGLESGRFARFPGAFATNSAALQSIGFILQLPIDSRHTGASRSHSAGSQANDVHAIPGYYVLFDYSSSVTIESIGVTSLDWFLLGSIAP